MSFQLSSPHLLAAAAGAVLSLLAACDEPVLLVVEVGLKYQTCNTTDPRQVVLTCPSTAGAWIRDGDGDILDQECVGVATATGQALSDLRTLFTSMDLNADSGAQVTVDVALFARDGAGSCVPPGDLAPDDRPEVILAGSGESDELSGSRGPVEVYVDCTETPARDTAEECHLVCADTLNDCEGGVATGACQQQRDECVSACEDEDCRAACAGPYETCLKGSIDGSCQLTYERCLETAEQAAEDCNRDRFACIDRSCGDQHDACFAACPSPGCALFPDRR